MLRALGAGVLLFALGVVMTIAVAWGLDRLPTTPIPAFTFPPVNGSRWHGVVRQRPGVTDVYATSGNTVGNNLGGLQTWRLPRGAAPAWFVVIPEPAVIVPEMNATADHHAAGWPMRAVRSTEWKWTGAVVPWSSTAPPEVRGNGTFAQFAVGPLENPRVFKEGRLLLQRPTPPPPAPTPAASTPFAATLAPAPKPAKPEASLPMLPLWPGFAVNTIFYAAIAWSVWWMPRALRRRRWRKREQCVRCGYELKGLAAGIACPECGLTKENGAGGGAIPLRTPKPDSA